jgi:5-methylcytosine-specific restriction endonuclease McrA
VTGSRSDRTGFDRAMTRANGLCEGCGGQFSQAFDEVPEIHHRKLRSGGGGHDLVNLLVLHRRCHAWAHEHPSRARAAGWIVSRYGNPAEERIIVFDPRGSRR